MENLILFIDILIAIGDIVVIVMMLRRWRR